MVHWASEDLQEAIADRHGRIVSFVGSRSLPQLPPQYGSCWFSWGSTINIGLVSGTDMNLTGVPVAAPTAAARAFAGSAFVIGLAAGLVLLTQFGFLDVWQQNIRGGDFSQFWVGARVFVTGGDPYDPSTWPAKVLELGGQDAVTPVFVYPAWVLLVLAPLGPLELPVAARIWIGSTLLIAAVGLFLLLEQRARQLPLVHTLIAFSLVGSEPGIVSFYSGQWSFLLIGALSVVSLFLHRPRRALTALAALAAAAMLIKPQLFLLANPALLRIAVARQQRRFALIWMAVAAAAVVASAVLLPRWWEPWSSVANARAGDIRAASLTNAMRDTLGDVGLVAALLLLAGAVGLAFAFSPRSAAAWPVWLTVSLNAAPYIFVYDHAILLVPLALTATILGRDRQRRALLVTAIGCALLVVGGTLLHAFPGVQHQTLSYNGLVPFAMAMLLIVALWPYRRLSEAQ